MQPLSNALASLQWFRRQIVAQFAAHGLTKSAAALTYTTLFAVVPLTTVAYAILSVLPDFARVGERVQAYVFQNFVPESSALVRDKLSSFSEQAQQLSVIGTIFLAATAFLTLVTVEQAFNSIWNVKESRRGLQRFVTYWAVLTCGPLLVVGGLLISSYLFSLPLVADVDTIGAREKILGYLPLLLSAAGFTVLYSAVPNCYVPFRHALLGGIASMVVFEAAKRAFGWAVAHSNVQLIYGTFAAVPLFLVWIYFFWVVVLSGAIVVRTLSLPRDPADARQEPQLILCLRVLKLLYAAHREGRTVAERELRSAVVMRVADRDRVIQVLHAMDLVVDTDRGDLMLARDLRDVTLLDLYRRLPDGVDVKQLDRVEGLDRAVARLKAFAGASNDALTIDLDRLYAQDAEHTEDREVTA
jgi:membrane protein